MTPVRRGLMALLGLMLGAQAVGKIYDMHLYAVALDGFHALPKSLTPTLAALWVVVELVALGGLCAGAARSNRRLARIGAAAALLDALAYAALSIGTRLRGIEVLNCTCYGAFLPQRLSTFVLLQDLWMVTWTAWTVWSLRPKEGRA